MARPIEVTPTLRGEEAKIFVENMLKTQKRKPNSIEKDFVKISTAISIKDLFGGYLTRYPSAHIVLPNESSEPTWSIKFLLKMLIPGLLLVLIILGVNFLIASSLLRIIMGCLLGGTVYIYSSKLLKIL